MASDGALTGAPGAVLLYGLIGLIVWPNGRPGGLLGVRGARIAWAALWLVMAWLWLRGAEQQRQRDPQRDQRRPVGDELAEQRPERVCQHHQGQRRW